MNDETSNLELPPWFSAASPSENHQESLFKVPLEFVLARAKVSSDELNRWHSKGWVSFASVNMELNDHDDPKIRELLFVRDVVRSGLTDAQITQLFARCPKPYSFDPDRTAFSFRYGLVQVSPPLEPDEPEAVIEAHLGDWIEQCDIERLASLRDQIAERLNNYKEEKS